MTEVLNQLPADIFNDDGKLKPGVKVVDSENGEVVMEGPVEEAATSSTSNKFPSNHFDKDSPLFLGDNISGDFHELRDVLLQRTRHNIFNAIKCLDYRRVCLMREHLLQLAAYHIDHRATAHDIADICTRLLSGDKETDLSLNDDVFDIPDDLADSDDDDEVIQSSATMNET